MKNLNMYADLAKKLELNSSEQHQITQEIIDYIEKYTASIPDSKAFYANKSISRNFFDVKKFTDKWSSTEIIQFFENVFDQNAYTTVSPGSFGYIPGSGLYPTALADFIASATNRYATYYEISPPAVELENLVVKWLCQLMGYSEQAGGSLTSGGSSANLIALHVARKQHQLKGVDFAKTVIYLTEHTHHSIQKSLHVIGLEEAICRIIPVDRSYHMNCSILEDTIQNDLKIGLKPWLIVAAAGTTNLGSVDPLNEIADLSEKYRLWFHVDAAYGGFFMLTEHGAHILKAIHRADSIILDPHKSLFLSYGTGAVLIKHREQLLKTYFYSANYMPSAMDSEEDKIAPCNLSFELTRNFRGLRVWLPMKIFGIEPFKAALEEKLLLTKYFYEKIRAIENIETACAPDLSIVAFRYVPQNSDADKFNAQLAENIKTDGRVVLTTTKLDKKNIYQNGLFIISITS